MVFLLRKDNFESYGEEKIYTDKLFIFKDVLSFSTIDTYALLFEQILPFMENATMHEGLKARLQKLLTIGANLKYFNVGDFSEYNRDNYLKKLEEGIELMYNKVDVNNCLVEFDMTEVTDIEVNLYLNGYKETKQLVACNKPEEGFAICFPKEVAEKYERHIVLAVEKITGSFDDDVVLTLLNMFQNISVDTGIKDFSKSYSVCKINCHQEIAFALKKLIGTVTYLKNCTSLRSNELFGFDEVYFQNGTEYIEGIIGNSVRCLQ